MDAHKNFAITTVAAAPSPADTGTSLTVKAGESPRLPATPFNAVAWPETARPDPVNAEVVRVTNRSGDDLTITRAQEGSTARLIQVGDKFVAPITAKTLTDIETALDGHVTDQALDGEPHGLPALPSEGYGWVRDSGGGLVAQDLMDRTPQGVAGGDLTGDYPDPLLGAGVVRDTHVAVDAAIAESKLALASDGADGTPTRRSMGLTAGKAARGVDQAALAGTYHHMVPDMRYVSAAGAAQQTDLILGPNGGFVLGAANSTFGTFLVQPTEAPAVGSLSSYLLLRLMVRTNAVAPGQSVTLSLKPVTGWNGASGTAPGVSAVGAAVVSDSIASAILGANVTGLHGTIAAMIATSDVYVFTVSTSGALAAGAVIYVRGSLLRVRL